MIPIESRIYLASRSPRRRELLHQIGVPFDLMSFRAPPREDPEVDERVLPDESPEHYVVRVARAKASHADTLIHARHFPSRLLLAADTTLDLDGEIIGKPHDIPEAIDILSRLSGREHRILTAVAVSNGREIDHTLSISTVRFRDLNEAEIRHYAHTGEPLDKAGAYAIQGHAGMFVAEIHGSHSGIVGLPLCETALLLRRFGYPI